MRLPWQRAREARSIEDPTVPVSASNFMAFFGIGHTSLPEVTIEAALQVPAVNAAVNFLSRTMAALPLHAYRDTTKGPQRLKGKTATTIHEFWTPGMDGFKARQYFWQQVFTGGRGLAWIERRGSEVEAIWPIDPRNVTVRRQGLALSYVLNNGQVYPAADVIDVAYMLKPDMTGHYGPVMLAAKAIQLALAMNDYGSNFFAGGGVPPLALSGPLPQGADAMKRALNDMYRAIDAAKATEKPIFPIPPGHELKAVGFDPEKGQMVDARLMQVQEIARVYQLPPVFLHDLSHASFSNAEQQDLHFVKHLIGQWARALEGEMTLKLFGRAETDKRYVEHNLNGLLRGDFKTRTEGLAQAIMTGQVTPNEGRQLEGRPASDDPLADQLWMQGATVPISRAAAAPEAPPPGGPQDGQ